MSTDDDKIWTPVRPEDVTDLALLPGEMRAFRVEMRDEIRSIAGSLQVLVRIDAKLDAVIDRQNHQDKRIDAIELRLAALEAMPVRRKTARKKR
jgi:hypothetical protein